MIGMFCLLALTSRVMSAITEEFSCTDMMATYNSISTACSNVQSDVTCKALYVESAAGVGYPAAGNNVQRPFLCYSTNIQGGSVSNEMRKAAINSCPKTCGMCCLTTAYNCTNAQFPNMNCGTILPSQCTSPIWREKIAQNCPAACGFCNEGGCVDGVTDCANDVTICTNIQMQDFVNQYCKKTCARCTASPSNPSLPSGPSCTRYPADTSASCAAWANNGFCRNEFYKDVWRQYCATTCRIC